MSENQIEWKQARTHREPKWPLMGYAPGNYISRCDDCSGNFVDMDKRATQCLPCAIEAASVALAKQAQKIRELKSENETLRSAISIASTTRQEQTP